MKRIDSPVPSVKLGNAAPYKEPLLLLLADLLCPLFLVVNIHSHFSYLEISIYSLFFIYFVRRFSIKQMKYRYLHEIKLQIPPGINGYSDH